MSTCVKGIFASIPPSKARRLYKDCILLRLNVSELPAGCAAAVEVYQSYH